MSEDKLRTILVALMNARDVWLGRAELCGLVANTIRSESRAIVREEMAAVTVSRVYSRARPDGPYRLVRDPVWPADTAEPKPVPRGHCEWRPEDVDGNLTGETCCAIATHLSCVPFVDTPTCSEHKCRCAKPIAGCGAPYETSGAGGASAPEFHPQPAVGPEAPQGEAGASTVDDEATRIAIRYAKGGERHECAAEIRAYRDREVAFWQRMTLRGLCGCLSADCRKHGAWATDDFERVAALSAKEPKP